MMTQRFENEVILKQSLKRRGFNLLSYNPIENLIFYPQIDEILQTQFYQFLKRYSFRIFLKDLIKKKEGFCCEDLTRYCSAKTIERYLKFLLKNEVISSKGEGYFQLNNPRVKSFGDTFEWFIAQVFQREFYLPASWGIRLKETKNGGDYDIMTILEGSFVYVETKSSPPKHIERQEILAFLRRINDLKPQMAIFIEDTRLRMKDKIVVMFEEGLEKMYGKESKELFPIQNLIRELYHIHDHLYIINSRPTLVGNISFCISHYLKGKGFFSYRPS
jgi:hypothetical protein